MRTFIENYLHFMKNYIRPHYEKLKLLKSGFIENLNFENNRDPWDFFWYAISNWWGPMNNLYSTLTGIGRSRTHNS